MSEKNTVKVFGNDDESLKILGQLLSNETSRKIIHILIKEEMYANQISKELGITMNLTLFHIKKLEELGLLIVTHKKIIKKGVDHKYYKMIPNLFVSPNNTKEDLAKKNILKSIFKDGVKILVVSICSAVSWLVLQPDTRPGSPGSPGSPDRDRLFDIDPLVAVLSIIITALVIEIIFLKKKKKVIE